MTTVYVLTVGHTGEFSGVFSTPEKAMASAHGATLPWTEVLEGQRWDDARNGYYCVTAEDVDNES